MIATRLRQWIAGPNAATPTQRRPDRLQASDAATLLEPFKGDIAAIRARVGVPPKHWHSLYQTVLNNYAELVQRVPASESHHHSGPGGLLQHGLEVARHALDLRQGVMLPPTAAPEDQAKLQDLWTYACLTAAFLHDLGKPVTDQHITLYDGRGHSCGAWSPLQGPMVPGTAYSIEFNPQRIYRQHERIPPLLAHHMVPPEGLAWLAGAPDALFAWLAAIQGDLGEAGAIGEIIGKADGLSVARNLSGGIQVQLPTAKAKPLAERLMTGLRYLLGNGELPLNRRGAVGYLDGDTLWLVSKSTLDKLRTHLIEEGQPGIPTRNDRLMDELQQHSLLVPNGDRAIWHCSITIGDWQKQLTCLRVEAGRIWADAARQPESMEGSVEPVDAATENASGEPAGTAESQPAAPSTSTANTATQEDSDSSDGLPMPFDVTAEPAADNEAATADKPDPEGESSVEPDPPTPTAETATNSRQPDGQVPGMDPATDAGERFVVWLKQSIENDTVPINTVKARIHVLPEGLALVSPRIFRDFDSANWSHVQKRFQKLQRHRKTPKNENIWTCIVEGGRKQSILKVILIPDAATALDISLPDPNPAVTLLERK